MRKGRNSREKPLRGDWTSQREVVTSHSPVTKLRMGPSTGSVSISFRAWMKSRRFSRAFSTSLSIWATLLLPEGAFSRFSWSKPATVRFSAPLVPEMASVASFMFSTMAFPIWEKVFFTTSPRAPTKV